MVFRKIDKSKTRVKRGRAEWFSELPKMRMKRRSSLRERFGRLWWVFLAVLALLVAMFTLAGIYREPSGGEDAPLRDELGSLGEVVSDEQESSAAEKGSGGLEAAGEFKMEEELDGTDVKPKKIDLQPVVDEWVKEVRGNQSVLIYDLEREEVVGKYNEKEQYDTASLYKLFVVYEGYRRVQSGEWERKARVEGTSKTVAQCLDLAIRESHSPCAEGLWEMIGIDELDEIIKSDFKIKDSDISDLASNAQDITKMMKLFYEHKEITDKDLLAVMKDSFLNQPETTYDWRQGLPSGFSNAAKVYDKVGWEYDEDRRRWNIYHDAAIVEFPALNRHFVVVVMTNYVSYNNVAKLGRAIEEAVLRME